MCRRSRASPVRTLIVFLPIFQIGPKTFNLMRLFLRDDIYLTKVKTLHLNCLPSIYKVMQTKNAIESVS